MESPFTGLLLKKELEGKRPVVVSIDGSLKAFPQAGLGEASMVFSSPTEAGITRYMAVFLDNAPNLAGPIRSARPYFIDWAIAYQPFFVHSGGSPEAIERLKREKTLINLDYIYIFNERGKQVPLTLFDFFTRREDRVSPHNIYVDIRRLRDNIGIKEVKSVGAGAAFKSDNEVADFSAYESIDHKNHKIENGKTAGSVRIAWGRDNIISYHYRDADNKYLRFVESRAHSIKFSPHIDEFTKKGIEADNLVLIWANSKPIPGDLKGRISIKTLDKGRAMFFMDGRVIKGSWLKINYDMSIRFFDEKGEKILFNPGNLWIEVITKAAKVKIEKKSNA